MGAAAALAAPAAAAAAAAEEDEAAEAAAGRLLACEWEGEKKKMGLCIPNQHLGHLGVGGGTPAVTTLAATIRWGSMGVEIWLLFTVRVFFSHYTNTCPVVKTTNHLLYARGIGWVYYMFTYYMCVCLSFTCEVSSALRLLMVSLARLSSNSKMAT